MAAPDEDATRSSVAQLGPTSQPRSPALASRPRPQHPSPATHRSIQQHSITTCNRTTTPHTRPSHATQPPPRLPRPPRDPVPRGFAPLPRAPPPLPPRASLFGQAVDMWPSAGRQGTGIGVVSFASEWTRGSGGTNLRHTGTCAIGSQVGQQQLDKVIPRHRGFTAYLEAGVARSSASSAPPTSPRPATAVRVRARARPVALCVTSRGSACASR